MLGRTLRLPLLGACPLAPTRRGPSRPGCPTRSPPPVVTSSRGWGPIAAEGNPAPRFVLQAGRERLRRGHTVGVKGRAADGGSLSPQEMGLGSAEAWLWLGIAPARQASVVVRRPLVSWSRMVRGERRWRCLLAGLLLLTSSTWTGERGRAHIRRNMIFVGKLKRLSGGSALSLLPLSLPILPPPVSLLLKVGVGCEKLHCATKTESCRLRATGLRLRYRVFARITSRFSVSTKEKYWRGGGEPRGSARALAHTEIHSLPSSLPLSTALLEMQVRCRGFGYS